MEEKYNKYIDHTILKADATEGEIKQLIETAKDFDFASVCINPCWVKMASELLKETDVKVCTVIGFPLGANTVESKVFETQNAILNGAKEVDMVINIGELKSQHLDVVAEEIRQVVAVAKEHALVKVIIETCLLTKEEIATMCEIVMAAGADFIKTSTGFSTKGAQLEDIILMKKIIGNRIGIKASGGVKNFKDMQAFIQAGATRIGTSSGVAIIKEAQG